MKIREALAADLDAVVAMLADDMLGAARERPGDPAYAAAFAAMQAQTGNHLLVAESDGAVIGCLQLIVLPSLSRAGAIRAEVEGVRVSANARGRGVGEALMQEAMRRAREAGASLMQLTSDLSRKDAHRFYERLGFVGSHLGMKRAL